MNITKKSTLWGGLAVLALCCGTTNVQAGSAVLTCLDSGTWNAKGVHNSTSNYQIGFSTELPSEQASYFVFDLTPVKGKTITACNLLIIGSNDYNITTMWPGHGTGPNFKVGVAPQGSDTLSQVLTGNNSTTIYLDGADANRNQDLGYNWVPNGLHTGTTFDAFHYNNSRLQTEVNAGGQWVFWSCDRFDTGAGSENYIWGSTAFTTAIKCNITYQ